MISNTHSKGFSALGINLSNVRNGACTCPKCSASRKKSSDRCMKISENGFFRCFHCGFTGRADSNEWIDGGGRPTEFNFIPQTLNTSQKKTYKPAPKIEQVLSDAGREFLKSRGITDEVIDRNKVVTNGDAVAFQYFVGERVITRKYRAISEKKFWFDAETKPCLYKLNDIGGKEFAIITEGEIDALSFEVAGVKQAVSIDKGAPNAPTNLTQKQVQADENNGKLKCLETCVNYLVDKKEIYLALDDDPNGNYLKEILIYRFGRDKCRIVSYPDGCKDPNEVLMKYGADKLASCLLEAKEPPIKDIQTADECWEDILNDFEQGEEKGESAYVDLLIGKFSWVRTFLYVWYGMPNHGKTEFMKYLMVLKSVHDGDVWAVFSPEHSPAKQYYKELIRVLTGKVVARESANAITYEELQACRDFIDKHFIFVYPTEQKNTMTEDEAMQSPEWIVNKISELAISRGVTGFVIDPWNQLDHLMKNMRREDQYLSHWLKVIKRTAQNHNLFANIVTHPKSIQGANDKAKKLTWYDISGGAMWSNKSDVIILVNRPNFFENKDCTMVDVDIQKAKQQHIFGKPDKVTFHFDRKTHWYFSDIDFKESDMEGSFESATKMKPLRPVGFTGNTSLEWQKQKSFSEADNLMAAISQGSWDGIDKPDYDSGNNDECPF